MASKSIAEEHLMRLMLDKGFVAALILLVTLPAAAQSPMRKVRLVPAESLAALAWMSLASDAAEDVQQRRLPDAKALSYAIDVKADLVWFRVNTYEPVHDRWFGINVAIDSDDSPDNGMTWWGTNKVKFDRLASAYLFRADDVDWQGYFGVADSESATRNVSSLTSAIQVAVDRKQRAVLLGIPRSALGTAPTIRVIATVGSMLINNDDVPNEGMVTLKLRP
jgi:hypothetical protein